MLHKPHTHTHTHTHCTRQERHVYFLSVMGWRDGRWVEGGRKSKCVWGKVRPRERKRRLRETERDRERQRETERERARARERKPER